MTSSTRKSKYILGVHVELQCAIDAGELPDAQAFESWAQAVLENESDTEVLIRIVDEHESAQLNEQYRDKQGPTNVLSFPFELPTGVTMKELELDVKPLGDLVMCAPVIRTQAEEQGKSETSHWAHMTVHGVLHLLGMDHQTDEEAELMEGRETGILHDLGFPPPYEVR